MKWSGTAFVLLLVTTASVLGQTVRTIDTRGKDPTSPSQHLPDDGQVVCGSGIGFSIGKGLASDGQTRFSIQVTFSLIDSPSLEIGSRLGYEIELVNKRSTDLAIPQSLDWADVDSGEHLQQYETANVNFDLKFRDGARTAIEGNIAFYGKKSKPSTMLVLHPGDSVRILGNTQPIMDGVKVPENAVLSGDLRANINLGSAGVRRTRRPECHGYEEFAVYSAPSYSSVNVVPVQLRRP
jgi:hypothetical protein